MPARHNNDPQTINCLFDSRSYCSFCSVLWRFLTQRPTNRSGDNKVINKVVFSSVVVFALVLYCAVQTAIILSDKTLELARLQRQEKAVEAILSMNLKELSQVNLNDPKWMN